jgi:ubiquitin C-terminal hydrolase
MATTPSTRAFRPDSSTLSKSKSLGLVGLDNIGNTCFM